jgi:hypothetical protein
MHPLLMSMRTLGSLVITLPSEIILKWKGQETAWIEITITQTVNSPTKCTNLL